MIQLLSSSNEPVVVKTAAQTICSIANQSKSNGDEQVKLMLAECGEQVVGVSSFLLILVFISNYHSKNAT